MNAQANAAGKILFDLYWNSFDDARTCIENGDSLIINIELIINGELSIKRE